MPGCWHKGPDCLLREQAAMWHPDRNAHTVELARRKFEETKIALDILSDETTRRQYDLKQYTSIFGLAAVPAANDARLHVQDHARHAQVSRVLLWDSSLMVSDSSLCVYLFVARACVHVFLRAVVCLRCEHVGRHSQESPAGDARRLLEQGVTAKRGKRVPPT